MQILVASYLDSKNERTFIQKALNNANNDTDIYSETKGEKYSIIGEGIYENNSVRVSYRRHQAYTGLFAK